jgi:hypothetical protein
LRLAKQVIRYLKGTRSKGISYGIQKSELDPQTTNQYTLYSDATWGTESDKVSFHGWTVVRSGGAVIWVSQRQRSTALSSLEAEFVAGSEASKEAAWLEKLSYDLDEKSNILPTLYIDNKGSIDLIYDHRFHNKAKHIDIRYNFIRNDMVWKDRLRVEHIAGTQQPADVLTKQLAIDRYRQHVRTLGMRD